MRHGQSVFNKEKILAGWSDVELTDEGRQEASRAAERLKGSPFNEFDIIFTSQLRRAMQTAWIVKDHLGVWNIPLERSWCLNERHYGALQGKKIEDLEKEHGEEQVLLWRRGYDVRPPRGETPPHTESLRDLEERVMPYWRDVISSQIQGEKRVLIVSHNNTLRVLIRNLAGLSPEELSSIELKTATPLLLKLDQKLECTYHGPLVW